MICLHYDLSDIWELDQANCIGSHLLKYAAATRVEARIMEPK